MNKVFPLLIFISVFFGLLTGNTKAVAEAALGSAGDAVTLSFSLMGTICLWSGMMETANAAGITASLEKVLSVPVRLLFGKLSPEAAQAITMNISANLLGLGNAATPTGLAAMRELQKSAPGDTASDRMVLFTTVNTSSLQIIPTTLIGLRLACGSNAPAEILPAVWITSGAALAASVLAAKLLSRVFR